MGIFGKKKRVKPGSPREQWCLALGAMYVEESGALAEQWEIYDDYFEDGQLKDESDRGYLRKECALKFCRLDMDMGKRYRSQAQELLAQQWEVSDETSLRSCLEGLKAAAQPGDRAGLAWNLGRYIHVIRLAVVADMLEAEPAWQLALQVEAPTRAGFSSWAEFGDAFVVGRTEWAGSANPDIARAVQALSTDPLSPWVLIPWAG